MNTAEFNSAYDSCVLGNDFFEEPRYYETNRGRYRKTFERLDAHLPPDPMHIVEIGGGQIALLCDQLRGDRATVVDVSDQYSQSVTKFGLAFSVCDLLHDQIVLEEPADALVLCEVVEHLPVPLHGILEKLRTVIKPGGLIFITTPNLYRVRNIVRLITGKPIFCPLFYPNRGQGIGHPLEFDDRNLRWHIEKAGFVNVEVEHRTLSTRGASFKADVGRAVAKCCDFRPRWRDKLIAIGVVP